MKSFRPSRFCLWRPRPKPNDNAAERYFVMQAALRPGMPASIGSPPPPPSRSKQQWVAGLQVESHGLPAWISDIFAKAVNGSQAGMPLDPEELLELLDDELELELELEVEPLLDPLEPLLEPASFVDPPVGGGSDALLSSSFSSPLAPGPGSRSEADSAQAETDEATRTEATRPEAMRARADFIEADATGTSPPEQSP